MINIGADAMLWPTWTRRWGFARKGKKNESGSTSFHGQFQFLSCVPFCNPHFAESRHYVFTGPKEPCGSLYQCFTLFTLWLEDYLQSAFFKWKSKVESSSRERFLRHPYQKQVSWLSGSLKLITTARSDRAQNSTSCWWPKKSQHVQASIWQRTHAA